MIINETTGSKQTTELTYLRDTARQMSCIITVINYSTGYVRGKPNCSRSRPTCKQLNLPIQQQICCLDAKIQIWLLPIIAKKDTIKRVLINIADSHITSFGWSVNLYAL